MLDGTYTGLQASIASFANRTDLTATIPDFIVLAESEMNRAITVRRQIGRATATISSEFAAIPSDYSGMRAFRLTTGTTPTLTYVSPERMAELKDQFVPTGAPQHYSIVGGEFEFWPVPDASYTASISYYKAIPALASASTNWVLTGHPDAYLNGALKYLFVKIKDDQRAAEADGLFQRSIAQINAQSILESLGGAIAPIASGLVV